MCCRLDVGSAHMDGCETKKRGQKCDWKEQTAIEKRIHASEVIELACCDRIRPVCDFGDRLL